MRASGKAMDGIHWRGFGAVCCLASTVLSPTCWHAKDKATHFEGHVPSARGRAAIAMEPDRYCVQLAALHAPHRDAGMVPDYVQRLKNTYV